MNRILCAVRGGPGSEKTISNAIALAKKERVRLVFLYVINLGRFLSSSGDRIESMATELRRMGEYVLLMAQAMAAREGVVADTFVREGGVLEEIFAICQEMRIDSVMMGKPNPDSDENCFSLEKLEAFAAKMNADYEVRIILAENDLMQKEMA
ncbi:MAG: universal stress protein [Anaerolineae bacterium]|jgi:nucleotide-binding universal stress UspA family protein|nr:universal stress protein [Anaerolineae bacterium]MBT7190380.1 universal stress protein [Anaerolineae bacterium]MBT7989182.1 universal stress protein [Anaerolineae bacterium]